MIKLALPVPPSIWSRVGGHLTRAGSTAGNWLKNKRPTWAGTKRVMIGTPTQTFNEIRSGKAFRPGGILRKGFRETYSDPLSAAFWYGLPAYDAYKTLKDPNVTNKAEATGSNLGGAILGGLAYKPFGLLGSMGLGMLGSSAGSAVGNRIAGPKPQAMQQFQPQPYTPQAHNNNPYMPASQSAMATYQQHYRR
jgi:hypothetical protein